MKVKELIKLLGTFDNEQEVAINCPDFEVVFQIVDVCEYEQENVKNVYIEI